MLYLLTYRSPWSYANDDSRELCGIFSTEEKTREARRTHQETFTHGKDHNYDISKLELDELAHTSYLW